MNESILRLRVELQLIDDQFRYSILEPDTGKKWSLGKWTKWRKRGAGFGNIADLKDNYITTPAAQVKGATDYLIRCHTLRRIADTTGTNVK